MTKPPYRIPLMSELATVEPNGLNVVSTFSGCGGSCLGFKMAGYRPVWASEFIEAARETYVANSPGVPIDARDIREVTGDSIRDSWLLDSDDELDVLEGSPPCASFSLSGKRNKLWGAQKKYSDTTQRADDLFFEFARILGELKPRAFVAENVKGLVQGAAIGYSKEIFSALTEAGYDVQARVLDAQWLGVPQHRERVIFVGTRKDLSLAASYPSPLPYRYTIREVLDESPTDWRNDPETGENISIEKYSLHQLYRSLRPGTGHDARQNLTRASFEKPSPCVVQTGGNVAAAGVCHPSEPRRFTLPELRRICGFPDDFVLTGSFWKRWERLGRAVPPPMMKAVAEKLSEVLV